MSESARALFGLLFFGTLAVTATAVGAAPSISTISGSLDHGNTLTIVGTGFGGKANAAPIRWEMFEDGTVGQPVSTTGYWSAKTPALTLFDDDSHIPLRHSHSSRHVRWGRSSQATLFSFYKDNIGFATTGKAYVNLWLYIDFISGEPELSQGWQLKLFRIHGNSDHASRPLFYSNVMTLDEVTVSYWVCGIYNNRSIWPGSGWMKEHYWVNMAMEYKDSSAIETADGQAHFYSSKAPPSAGVYYKGSRTDIVTRTSAEPGWCDCLSMGYLLTNGGEAAYTYWDDIYIDNSWARVEIGDADTYAACRHREMQIPSAWSNTSVTVTLNQGSLDQIEGKYLYVVNEDGVVNASGYPLVEPTCTLTVTNGTGSGQYDPGTSVNISADPPPAGKLFAWWIGDTAYLDDRMQPDATVTMPAADVSVTATYAWGYQLTVNSGSGSGLYLYYAAVDVQADPAPSNMRFDAWTGDVAGLADVGAAATSYTMPNCDCEITATYGPIIPGDLDCSGFVGQGDLDIVLDNWGMSPPPDSRADPTGDDFVGQDDLDVVLDHWGEHL